VVGGGTAEIDDVVDVTAVVDDDDESNDDFAVVVVGSIMTGVGGVTSTVVCDGFAEAVVVVDVVAVVDVAVVAVVPSGQ
jgi:hypothetical protein